ncbi:MULTISPECIES: hypothetical protein [unclassified Tenacibaculum]|uniref:hypothetical protein n=1 Tax=unclassified Tenacibaculum TaxID=2635139 RepID=UPI001F46E392|nr:MULTISPECIES: hypothetical protein [unclassified Tenacibaculum]MCF2873996.1 hypothetical protein [Tenacibaculum sp. Cn5-1]MCF2934577.1 hypothetical protein [Tenacibaculum sp. Cn5-34]MCG7510787.1 hypothetical protein [Tenacibaculum sp. Cn5-46]
MREKLFIIFCFISFALFSQYKAGSIYLKDGSIITGDIKIVKYNRIVLKKNDSKKGFDHNLVTKVVFNDSIEHHYKKRRKTILLLKREVSGPLELYSLASYFSGFSDGSGAEMYMNYYLGKKGNDFVNSIPSKIGKKRFRKFITEYAPNCKKFLDKIQDKKSIRSNFDSNIVNIVNYINNNCKE